VLPEEDKVALAVERDDLPPAELGLVVREERPEQAPHAPAQARGEAVEQQLGHVLRARAVPL
jgi:hypothetical protein